MEKETDGMERSFSVDLRIESPVPFPFRCKAKSFGKFEAETMENGVRIHKVAGEDKRNWS